MQVEFYKIPIFTQIIILTNIFSLNLDLSLSVDKFAEDSWDWKHRPADSTWTLWGFCETPLLLGQKPLKVIFYLLWVRDVYGIKYWLMKPKLAYHSSIFY